MAVQYVSPNEQLIGDVKKNMRKTIDCPPADIKSLISITVSKWIQPKSAELHPHMHTGSIGATYVYPLPLK